MCEFQFSISRCTDKPISGDSTYRGKSNHQKSNNATNGGLNVVLYDKLNEVIGEGILDSILPFICAASKQSNRNNHNGKAKISQVPVSKDTAADKSITPRQSATQDPRKIVDGNILAPIHKDRNGRRRSSHSIGVSASE